MEKIVNFVIECHIKCGIFYTNMKPSTTILLVVLCILYSCAEKSPNRKIDRIYFENGQLRREVKIVYGLKEGAMTDYYNTGKLHSIRNFLHNIQCGKSTFYHEDGITLKEVQYYDQQGLRTEGDTLWYKNGVIEFTADFKNGQKNGLLARYDSTGKILYRANFKNDTLQFVY